MTVIAVPYTDKPLPYPFSLLNRAGRLDGRLMALLAAIIIYGAFSSPTPDDPGLIELLIGLLLAVVAGGPRALAVFRPKARASWQKNAQILLFYGLSVPVFMGLISGASLIAMIRDIIPFLFFLLPLFVTLPALREPRSLLLLTAVVVAAGMLFALRVVLPPLQGDWSAFWHPLLPADPFYLANAPTVLLGALLLTGLAGRELYRGNSFRRLMRAVLLAAAAFIPFASMVLVEQRASMGVMIAYIAFFLGWVFWHRPRRAWLPLAALISLLLAEGDMIAAILDTMVQKTHVVGINMRWQEALAVFRRVAGSPTAVLFGRGWGATVASPAVGGLTVNFTHSLLTTYWLKTGLCGLALALAYLYRMLRLLWPVARAYPLLGAALAAPLLIDVTLYASFKSFDFGLILLLIPLWAGQLHPAPNTYSIAPDFQSGQGPA